MDPLTFYCHPRCTTCAKARKWLTEHQIPFQEIDLTQTAPKTATLEDLWHKSGLPLKKFLNTSGREYRAKGKEYFASLTPLELLDALASNGMLIKRPVLTDGEKVAVGFKEEVYQTMFAPLTQGQ